MSFSTLALPARLQRDRVVVRRRLLVLAGLTLAALALRLVGIGTASLWSDEAFTALWIGEPLSLLWGHGLEIETTPALYYTLLKGWVAVLGLHDEAGLRMFSALCSALTVPLVYGLARAFAPVTTSLTAAAIFALMPMQVAYGQEARAYALLTLLMTATLLAALRVARGPRRGRDLALPAFALLSLALVYTHATAAFALAVVNLVLLGWLLHTGAGWRAVRALVAADALVALASLPQLNAMLVQAGRHDMAWFPHLDLVNLLNLANTLLVDPYSPQVLFRWSTLLAAGLGALLLLLVPRLKLGARPLLFLVGVPLAFVAVCMVVSLFSPFLIPRVLVWLGAPLAVLLALVLHARRLGWRRWLPVPVMLGCLVLGLHGTLLRATEFKEDWRGLLAEVRPRLAPGDLLAVGPSTSASAVFVYGGPGIHAAIWAPEPMPLPIYWPTDHQPATHVDAQALAAAVAEGRGLWLVMNDRDAASAAQRLPEGMPRPLRYTRAGVVALHWPGQPAPALAGDPRATAAGTAAP